MKTILIGLGAVLMAGVLSTFALGMGLFQAYAAHLVWGWHVVPALGVRPVGTVAFWALGAVFNCVFRGAQKDIEEKKRELSERVAMLAGSVLAPAFVILLAWVLV